MTRSSCSCTDSSCCSCCSCCSSACVAACSWAAVEGASCLPLALPFLRDCFPGAASAGCASAAAAAAGVAAAVAAGAVAAAAVAAAPLAAGPVSAAAAGTAMPPSSALRRFFFGLPPAASTAAAAAALGCASGASTSAAGPPACWSLLGPRCPGAAGRPCVPCCLAACSSASLSAYSASLLLALVCGRAPVCRRTARAAAGHQTTQQHHGTCTRSPNIVAGPYGECLLQRYLTPQTLVTGAGRLIALRRCVEAFSRSAVGH